MNITVEELTGLGANRVNAEKYIKYINEVCDSFQINTRARVCNFIAQIFHESAMLSTVEENLNYSAERLVKVFPSRFSSIDSALPFAHNPEKLAEKVYDGRMGNRPGDGYKYRGRGLIQLTGYSNYKAFSLAMGIDILGSPEMLLQPRLAVLVAGWFWSEHGCNQIADIDSEDALKRTTKVINGGTNGLKHRFEIWHKARIVFKDKEFKKVTKPVEIVIVKKKLNIIEFILELIKKIFKK